MISAGLIGLLLCIGTVVWLIRSVLPRTLSYSAFADQISHGNYSTRSPRPVMTNSPSWVGYWTTWLIAAPSMTSTTATSAD